MATPVNFPSHIADLLKDYDPEVHDIIIIIGRPMDAKMDIAMDVPNQEVALSLLNETKGHVENTSQEDLERAETTH